ncbi:hypothetical protein [Entomospira culicis]|uniref:Uncharacterized protein n=1 Tax=Entomospira culicis TaxID=2719989 RepID=A0A968GH82_9SPIO|nr:hypothetical protein [Entomospira culicis]NIZ19834.1 hypothetical protein [Entomospira culicis]NIZ70048.1 hypothetical protein [Entomospira culicis]WDI37154.1 hypothetical protein PVA46_07485 [Entomospira culicis]WDI38783.1 hypothetical protein PVA47_07495 [Entomospira culicis]
MQAVAFNGTFGGYLKRMSGFLLLNFGLVLVGAMMVFGALKTAGLEPAILFEEDFWIALSTVEENPEALQAYFEELFADMDESTLLAFLGLFGAIFLFILLMLVASPFVLSWYYRTLMRYFADVSRLGRHRVRFDGRMGGLIKLFFIALGVNILAGLVGAPFEELKSLKIETLTLVAGVASTVIQVITSAFVLHKWLEWGVPHLVVEESPEDFVYEGKFLQILKIYSLYLTPFYLVGVFQEMVHEGIFALMFMVVVIASPFLIRLFTRQILGLITYGERPLAFRTGVKTLFKFMGLSIVFGSVLIIVVIIPILTEAVMLTVVLVTGFFILTYAWWTYVMIRWVIRGIHYEELPNKEEDLGLE